MRTRLADKILGCLIGGALGDTLGRPVEGWDYDRIVAEHGLLDDPFPDWEQQNLKDAFGDVGTDDTSLGQLLCNAYLEKGGRLSAEDYAQAWRDRMDCRGYWFCMRNTFELLTSGYSARSTGAMNMVTGAGLMSVNPIAIFNACDPEQAYLDTLELVGMFQRDLSVLTGAVIAAGMAEAFRPDATPESIVEAAIRVAPAEPLVTYNKRSPDNLRDSLIRAAQVGRQYDDPIELRREAYEKLLQVQPFDPEETTVLTFALILAARGDTRLGIVGGVNMGRDADTLGSLVGQFYGALNGLSSLPAQWVERFMQLPGAQAFVDTGQRMADLVAAKAERETADARLVLSPSAGADSANGGEAIRERVSGCLLGGTAGSMVGRFVGCAAREGRPATQQTVDAFASEATGLPWGEFGTDIAALMMIACKAYIETRGRPAVEDEARVWMREVDPIAFGDGGVEHSPTVDYRRYCLRNTYELLKMGCPPRVVGAMNVPAYVGLNVVGAAAAFNAGDPDQAYLDALCLAALFQRDRGIIVPGVLAAGVAAAMRPGATVDSVIDAACRVAPSTTQTTALPAPVADVHGVLTEAVRLGRACTDAEHLFGAIEQDIVSKHLGVDPLQLLAATFGVFVFSGGDTAHALSTAACGAPNSTDAIAGACGLLCGALGGAGSIPPKWMEVVDTLSGASALRRAAQQMTDLAVARARKQTVLAEQVATMGTHSV